ncbi:hypothetical protein [Engelhardtia mirabilis]|uniref:Formylglycine-generating sulfatase enzyme n=1 Tax=Engelhardtia mirabilis TaxID=2528011 RepID=A0A518BFZ6_9BACT|nr:hypothetical protein Pla133_09520 [Planctomycetes bacterium Pla133]QDV00212.1 hypothetical protein Pla86_09510 [Planctomycetes bacterium Pla86]
MLQLLSRSMFALALCCLPLAAQVEYPRQVPDDAAFTATLEALKAGMEDGFASLRGARLAEESWEPVLPAGMANDDTRDPTKRRHTFSRFSTVNLWVIKLSFRRTYRPSEAEIASLEADYQKLGAVMSAAAGDWGLETSTTSSNAKATDLIRPTEEERPPFIRVLLTRGESWGEEGWWELRLIANTRLAEELPAWIAHEPSSFRGVPTDAGFTAAVEAILAGIYTGLEPIKGLVSPRELSDRQAGAPTWSLMPLEGLPKDPEGWAHHMTDFGSYVNATYSFAEVVNPTDEQRAELDARFEGFAGILEAHARGWVVEGGVQADSLRPEGSRCLYLSPGPGMRAEQSDGTWLPHISLCLSKDPSGYDMDTHEPSDIERWSLYLDCTALGSPRPGDGRADWIADLLDPVELPPVPAELERVVLELVADAPSGFAGHATPELQGEVDLATYVRALDDPILPYSGPRQALTTHLQTGPDPAVLRDYLWTVEDDWHSEASVRLGLLTVPDVDAAARFTADQWMDAVIERLGVALDGWRVRVEDLPGGKEDFQVRLATFDGLRPDGHPVWVYVDRMVYPVSVPGQPEGDLYQLALYIATDHEATVGQDLLGRWNAAVAAGEQPLVSVLEVLGDPLAGRVQPSDRFVSEGGRPIDLLGLFGGDGSSELRYDLVRDGRYTELVLTPPRLSLARWAELRAAEVAGELPPAALAVCGGRLDLDEVGALLRELVAAGEVDFATLPPTFAKRLELETNRQLLTARFVLWGSDTAATKGLVETVRAGLAATFGSGWFLEDTTRNTGPVYDPYARQTHWFARPEGPQGMHPWVELVEYQRDSQAFLALEVHAFTAAHRAAHAEVPDGLWFEGLAGNCENGSGVAWCYREQVSFEGPFVGGLPSGVGRHLYPGDKAMAGVRYAAGRLELIGHKQPPPAPVVASVGEARSTWFTDGFFDQSQDSVEDGWHEQVASEYGDLFKWWDHDGETAFPTGDSAPQKATYSSRVCGGCGGDGWVDTSAFVDDYDVSSTATSTGLWMKGYDAVETYKRKRRVYSSEACSRCAGTGREYY